MVFDTIRASLLASTPRYYLTLPIMVLRLLAYHQIIIEIKIKSKIKILGPLSEILIRYYGRVSVAPCDALASSEGYTEVVGESYSCISGIAPLDRKNIGALVNPPAMTFAPYVGKWSLSFCKLPPSTTSQDCCCRNPCLRINSSDNLL